MLRDKGRDELLHLTVEKNDKVAIDGDDSLRGQNKGEKIPSTLGICHSWIPGTRVSATPGYLPPMKPGTWVSATHGYIAPWVSSTIYHPWIHCTLGICHPWVSTIGLNSNPLTMCHCLITTCPLDKKNLHIIL